MVHPFRINSAGLRPPLAKHARKSRVNVTFRLYSSMLTGDVNTLQVLIAIRVGLWDYSVPPSPMAPDKTIR